jgi:hypothetical protein
MNFDKKPGTALGNTQLKDSAHNRFGKLIRKDDSVYFADRQKRIRV